MTYEMDEFIKLTEYNWAFWIAGFFALFEFFKWGWSAIEWIISKFGIETKGMRKRREQGELLLKTAENLVELQKKHNNDNAECVKHDELIREDLKNLTDTVNNLAIKFEKMQKKNNETKVKELKDTLINYYNKYRVIGEWSKLEKDAFWELFEDYESRGGNGYIHSIVEPVMRELKEID